MSEALRKSKDKMRLGLSEDELKIIHPVHPLPEEIRKMRRDETVCRYCGVSYLIHNEIKALESKLRAVQDELENYRGMEFREKELRKDLDMSQATSRELQTRLDSVLRLIAEKEKEINDRICHEKELESQLQTATKSLKTYKSKCHQTFNNIQKLNKVVETHRELLSSLKNDSNRVRTTLTSESQRLYEHLTELCSKPIRENNELRSEIEFLQKDSTALKLQLKEMESRLKDNEREILSLRHTEDKLKDLEIVCSQLQAENADASSKYSMSVSKNHELESSYEEATEKIRKLNVDSESLQLQLRNQQQASEQTASNLKKDLRELEQLLSSKEKELQKLKDEFCEDQKKGEEIARREFLSSGRAEELQKSLDRANSDLEAFRKEREMMIRIHQDQIEELRNSFKRKLAEVDLWPQKMEDILRLEKEKQTNELNLLEKKLCDNFVMEMQNEKQRHQQMMDKCIADGKDKETKLRNQLTVTGSQYSSEQLKLQVQLAGYKSQLREIEARLREEIDSQKKIIHDLELRLAKVVADDGGRGERVAHLELELLNIEKQLHEAEIERDRKEVQLHSARDEIGFLYDTVRRECEERNELTEALSQAQEQLLSYKRLGKAFSAPQQSLSIVKQNSTSSRRSAHSSASVPSNLSQSFLTPDPLVPKNSNSGSSGDATNARRGSSLLHPLASVKTAFVQSEVLSNPSNDCVSPNSVPLDYEGGRHRSPGRLRGSVMLESRKRLVPFQERK